MRRRRAFTLLELLLGAFLASIMGMAMLTWEGDFLRAFTRSSAWLLACERGQRVLAFIETKILHAGLGLYACREEGAFRRAFARDVPNTTPSIPRLLTVYQDKPILMTPVSEKDGVFCGTALGFLYARPSGLIVKRTGEASVVPGGSAEFSFLARDTASGVADAGFQTGYKRDLTNWCALPLAGMPFYIASVSGRKLFLSLASTVETPVDIPLVNELYLLQYEQFFVLNERLYYRWLEAAWSPYYPREEGVLALWIEWRPGLRVLDLWVLTTGGPALTRGTGRPAEWPEAALWREDFSRQTLCVSRASWRLENV